MEKSKVDTSTLERPKYGVIRGNFFNYICVEYTYKYTPSGNVNGVIWLKTGETEQECEKELMKLIAADIKAGEGI